MSRRETELIRRYFVDLGAMREDVTLGIGDDAALLQVPAGMELVLSTDSLVEGTHFLSGAPPHSLGHRALAVNLSDIAAMGAIPAWALLSLNLPQADDAWLRAFADGFGALACAHQVALVGGNLARGPLSITVQIAGWVPAGQALRRSGAGVDDLLYVSGSVGDAAAGRQVRSDQAHALRERFEYPTPRVLLGQTLRGLASACIDVSDGLYSAITQLLDASHCAATVDVSRLPLSAALRSTAAASAWRYGLSGGEDYELCFTLPPGRAHAMEAAAAHCAVPVTCLGSLQDGAGLTLMTDNTVMQFSSDAFEHFER